MNAVMRASQLAALLLVSSVVINVLPASGQSLTPLNSPDGQDEDRFGSAVAVSGDVAIAGSPGSDFDPIATYEGAGAAYVFRYDGSTWQFEEKLRDSDSERGGSFGYPVAVDGDVAVIAKIMDNDIAPATGAAYVFRYDGSTWTQEQKLLPDDAVLGDSFAREVAIDGDVIAVSSPSGGAGAVYVFRYDGSTWTQEQKLIGADANADVRMGPAIDVDGDVIAIGSRTYNLNVQSPGNAWVFRHDGSAWVEEDLPVAATRANAFFGESVAVDGDEIAVGASSADAGTGAGQLATGAVFVYRYVGGTWTNTQKLADGVFTGDAFGYSVSMDGNVLASGALNAGSRAGRVHVYVRSGGTWMPHDSFFSTDAMVNDFVGRDLGVSGSHIVASDDLARRSPQTPDVGRFHVYELASGVSIESDGHAVSAGPAVGALYPNPFSDVVTLTIEGATGSEPVHVEVYDLLGRRVETVVSTQSATHSASQDGRRSRSLAA